MKNGEYEVRDVGGGKALVVSPYNPDFVARVKALGGRWNPSERAWLVNSAALDEGGAARCRDRTMFSASCLRGSPK